MEDLDRSHYLIQKAKAQAKKEGLSIRFREGDARSLHYPPDTFDAIMPEDTAFELHFDFPVIAKPNYLKDCRGYVAILDKMGINV